MPLLAREPSFGQIAQPHWALLCFIPWPGHRRNHGVVGPPTLMILLSELAAIAPIAPPGMVHTIGLEVTGIVSVSGLIFNGAAAAKAARAPSMRLCESRHYGARALRFIWSKSRQNDCSGRCCREQRLPGCSRERAAEISKFCREMPILHRSAIAPLMRELEIIRSIR